MDKEALRKIWRTCGHHKNLVDRSTLCGCFYCQETFPPSEIVRWVDKNGTTAICPKCNVDSVLPNGDGLEITPELLTEMHKTYFSLPSR